MDAGIYAIYNTVNDKLYIGSAVLLSRRFIRHKKDLKRGAHHSPHLQRAWDKYGAAAFEFSLLEPVTCKEQLIEREQAWIDALGTADLAKGYNVVPKAGSSIGAKRSAESIAKQCLAQTGTKRSAEARANMSIAQKKRSAEISARQLGKKRPPDVIEKVRRANTGKKRSPEARANILAGNLSRPRPLKRCKASAETRAKQSLAHIGQTQPPETRAKIRAGMVLVWAKRRAAKSSF